MVISKIEKTEIFSMTMAQKIEEKLYQAFDIEHLEVVNQSRLHKGHAGDDGSGESHFLIRIKANDFKNTSKVAAHKKVFSALKNEMEQIHALSIQAEF